MTMSIEQILSCPALPTLPTVAARVLELTRDPDMCFDELTDAVQHDAGLTVRVLRVVNSSYYALSRPCSSVSRALTYLGVSTVKSLVLGFSLVDATRDLGGLDMNRFWRRALITGTGARRVGAAASWGDTEVAFTAGLLEDIGMFAFAAALGDDYSQLLAQRDQQHDGLAALERNRLGFDHAEVGARLAELWHLPPELAEAIGAHEDPGPEPSALTRVSWLTGQIATAVDSQTDDAALTLANEAFDTAAEWFSMPRGAIETALAVVGEDVAELSGLFEVGDGKPVDIHRILAEADDTRIAQSVALEREHAATLKAAGSLLRSSNADEATGTINRAGFDAAVTELHRGLQDSNTPFGLVLIGATVTTPQGEPALVDDETELRREVARRIARTVRETDLVYRISDELFGVLLPRADLSVTERAAQRICAAVGDQDAESPAEDPREHLLTANAGATAAEPGAVGVTPDTLARAATQALAAASEAGRNRVCIGRLRSRTAA